LVMTQRTSALRRFALAQLHEGSLLRVCPRQSAHVGQREVDVCEKRERERGERRDGAGEQTADVQPSLPRRS
jgi:hypothetical protein